MKLLVHVDKITPRVNYVFEHLLNALLGVQPELTTNAEKYADFNGPKFSYDTTPMDGLHFGAVELLSEEGINHFEPDHSTHNVIPTYFSVDQGALPFDPFAAAFFTLSRYEEYTTVERDKHGRFQADRSTLTRIGALEKPVVDHWAMMIAEKITAQFPELKLQLRPYKDLFTVDVDNAFAYKGRGLRSQAAVMKARLKGRAEEVKERKAVLAGEVKDPYDKYQRICDAIGDKEALIFFVLFANRGENDHGADPASADFQEAIKTMAKGAQVGIHPSYASNDADGQMQRERKGLGQVIGQEIALSRQHFLRFDLPKTYRALIAAGIQEEHSMGYADRCGFRAGTCRPFKWYDLEKEEATNLTIVPFATMDTAFADHQGFSADEAKEKIESIRQNLKAVDGPLVSVWHDRVLADREPYEGWWELFDRFNSEIA